MWERFSETFKAALEHAEGEAAEVGEREVGPEHLLLGLLHVEGCTASRVLARLQVNPLKLRSEVERHLVPGPRRKGQEITLSRAGKRVIERTYEMAREMGAETIGTGPLLLALAVDPAGVPARALAMQNVTLDRLRQEVIAGGAEALDNWPPIRGDVVPDEEFCAAVDRTLAALLRHARRTGQAPLLRQKLEETLARMSEG